MTFVEASIGWAGMIAPVFLLSLVALLLPIWMLKKTTEEMRSLVLVGVLSALVLFLLAAAYFGIEYGRRGVPVDVVLSPGGLMHLGRLAALSALIWLPILSFVLISQPSKWRPEL